MPGIAVIARASAAQIESAEPLSAPGSRPTRMLGLLVGLLAGLIGVALLAHATVGIFARYQWDDFGFASDFRDRSLQQLLRIEKQSYHDWYGRYTLVFLLYLTDYLGPVAVQLLPGALLGVLTGTLCWSIRMVGAVCGASVPWRSALVLAGLVVLATLELTPNPWQSFYWQTSSLSYAAPLVFAAAYPGLLAWLRVHWQTGPRILLVLAAGMPALIAGGCSETYAVAQGGIFLAAGGVLLAFRALRGAALTALTGGGLGGALLAVMILKLSPGNANRTRIEHLPPTPPLKDTILLCIHYSEAFVSRAFSQYLPLMLAVLVLPAALTLLLPASGRASWDTTTGTNRAQACILACPLVVLCGLPASFAAAVYSMHNHPPDRAQVVATFVLVVGLASWSLAVGLAARGSMRQAGGARRPLAICAALVLGGMLLNPVQATSNAVGTGRIAQLWAAGWDRRDHELRAAESRGVRSEQGLAVNDIGQVGDLFSTPHRGPNGFLEAYYGIPEISGR